MTVSITSSGLVFSTGNTKTTATITGLAQSTQSWASAISSRSPNTTYTNSTGKPILVIISIEQDPYYGNGYWLFYVDGIAHSGAGSPSNVSDYVETVICCIVPAGSTYSLTRITGSDPYTPDYWWEFS